MTLFVMPMPFVQNITRIQVIKKENIFGRNSNFAVEFTYLTASGNKRNVPANLNEWNSFWAES